ncbi:flagellar protein FliS [Noviherbaspirillum suwonense]|uniref:Flagellar secretion chaperone FliS n=2 Tax=Noviherbaspirillum suwonense TaxID=1224511 RepID=A0ABY1QQ00_9BURK|nr:flagellar protein FliS [Noviherbaspirillum suwonense]
MFGSSTSRGASAYANVGMESSLNGASPNKLTIMLYDGAIGAINMAALFMRDQKIEEKTKKISHAIRIIDSGLRASLDKKAGGEIAQSLDALYQFMSKRLLLANLKDDPVILEEVRSLLADLKSAWVGLEQQTSMSGTQSLAARPQASAYFNTGVAA